jgi:hypothetical protein
MKTILCILALLVFTATTADAYVRRTIGGGYVVRGAGAYSGRYAGGYYGRGYYGHPVARGAAVAAGAAVATGVAASAATGWGWNQPYYGSGYYGTGGYAVNGYPGYYGGYANRSYVTGRPTLIPRYYGADATAGYYPGSYGAYAAGGYPGYYGGYANRSYVTGRPTLIPRYYGSGW